LAEAENGTKNREYPLWQAVVNDFRTFNWIEMIKYPELTLQESKGLLVSA